MSHEHYLLLLNRVEKNTVQFFKIQLFRYKEVKYTVNSCISFKHKYISSEIFLRSE